VELPRLLGDVRFEDYPASRHIRKDDGKVEVTYDEASVELRPEQITAALFTKIKGEMVQKYGAVGPCVISVPGSFAPGSRLPLPHLRILIITLTLPSLTAARRAVLDAAAIAELPVTRLISSSAASIYSWLSRHADAESPVLIVDVGSGYANATLAVIRDGSAVMLASESSSVCGSREIDMALFAMVAAELKEKHAVEVTINTSLGQRLMKQCESTKKVLSTVAQANLFLEGAKGDADASFAISRAALEDSLQGVATGIETLVSDALKALPEGTPLGSVEIIGGGSCVPMVQAAVNKAVSATGASLTLSHTMDLSSSVGSGTAMACWAAAGKAEALVVQELGAWDEGLDAESGMGPAALEAALAYEASVCAKEAEIMAVEASRNGMEKLVYEMRAELDGRLKEHLNREATTVELQSLEDWLWSEEGEAASLAECEAKTAAVDAKLHELNAGYYSTMEEDLRVAKQKEIEDAKKWAAESAKGPSDGVNKDTRKLKYDDRMKLVISNKAEATELFKDGNTEHAAMRYAKALNHCDSFFDLSEEQKGEVKKAKAALYNNMAMCYIKLEKWLKARENCRYVLEIEPENVKALYRRAQTHTEEKNWDEAEVDIKKALELSPEDKAVARLVAVCAKGKKKEKDKAKKTFGKMFG